MIRRNLRCGNILCKSERSVRLCYDHGTVKGSTDNTGNGSRTIQRKTIWQDGVNKSWRYGRNTKRHYGGNIYWQYRENIKHMYGQRQ